MVTSRSYQKEGKKGEIQREAEQWEQGWGDAVPWTKGCRQLEKLEKARTFPQRTQVGTWNYRHLDASPGEPVLGFGPLEM